MAANQKLLLLIAKLERRKIQNLRRCFTNLRRAFRGQHDVRDMTVMSQGASGTLSDISRKRAESRTSTAAQLLSTAWLQRRA